VRRENHDDVQRDVGEQVVKAHALLGVEAGGRLVDDDEARVAEQRLRDAEALPHPAREAAELLLADGEEVDALEQCAHRLAPRLRIDDALQAREVVEQVLGGDARVDAEVLRQVAEDAAHCVLVAQHVDVAAAVDADQARAAGVGLLQRRERSHQRRLAGTVGAQQSEHSGRDRERHAVERADAVGIGLGEIADLESHVSLQDARHAAPAGGGRAGVGAVAILPSGVGSLLPLRRSAAGCDGLRPGATSGGRRKRTAGTSYAPGMTNGPRGPDRQGAETCCCADSRPSPRSPPAATG
jgi:hypothetical protein